jgi:hypothetical protein
MLKYLRIAVTAVCLTACVLLVGLWVRSYYSNDILFGPDFTSGISGFGSVQGGASFFKSSRRPLPGEQWRIHSDVIGKDGSNDQWALWPEYEIGYGFGALKRPAFKVFVIPHWFLILLFAFVAGLPWIPSRFTLRTILIATTLIAILLGLIVCLAG